MKKAIIIFGAIIFTSFILTSCGGKSEGSRKSTAKETHTCATCGATFDGPCTTDVFGKCVCSEGCSGR